MTQKQSYQPRTRLYVGDTPLHGGASIALGLEQAHYLRAVLRAEKGAQLEVFNGRDGAFAAQVTALSKASAALEIGDQTAAQEVLPAITLAFAIVKKDRVQMIAEKATELGAAQIAPIITARTQGQAVKQLKMEKLRSYCIEAAEQCGRTALPQLHPPSSFSHLLSQVRAPDHLLYADEMTAGTAAPWPAPTGHTTLLIGPEGGFAPEERTALQAHAAAYAITLGPRILRAETAALAALALWQSKFGGW